MITPLLRQWLFDALVCTTHTRKPRLVIMTKPFARALRNEFNSIPCPINKDIAIRQFEGVDMQIIKGKKALARVL